MGISSSLQKKLFGTGKFDSVSFSGWCGSAVRAEVRVAGSEARRCSVAVASLVLGVHAPLSGHHIHLG